MTNPARTYLDHNASAPLRLEARAAMLACIDEHANASSVHAEGRRARAIVETAREQVAALVGAHPSEVVFTSGATEANAWAIAGGWQRIIVGAHEHASILAPATATSAAITDLPVDRDGLIESAALAAAVATPDTPGCTLLSLQLANGETGAIQPAAEAFTLARSNAITTHTDAVQAAGRIPVDFRAIGCDLMSISAHKLGGPKGIGALVIRDGLNLPALLRGGGQERRRRAGTEAVMLIAGFGAAAQAARDNLTERGRIADLRRHLEHEIARVTPDAEILASAAPRLPNTICLARPGELASTLVIRLDLAGIAVSAGAACSSGKIGRSHVLAAMGVPTALADAAIRISLGWSTTADDVARFLDAWTRLATRPLNPTQASAARASAGAAILAGE